jgi:hypothetical protein
MHDETTENNDKAMTNEGDHSKLKRQEETNKTTLDSVLDLVQPAKNLELRGFRLLSK